jgi:hypothetical protein
MLMLPKIAKPFQLLQLYSTESKISVLVRTSLAVHSFLQFHLRYPILVQSINCNCIAVVAIIAEAAKATP